MKRQWDGIGNRGAQKPEDEETPFLPTTRTMAKAANLRNVATSFIAVSQEIQDIAPERSKLLKKRAQLIRLRVAMMLLGEDERDDD